MLKNKSSFIQNCVELNKNQAVYHEAFNSATTDERRVNKKLYS